MLRPFGVRIDTARLRWTRRVFHEAAQRKHTIKANTALDDVQRGHLLALADLIEQVLLDVTPAGSAPILPGVTFVPPEALDLMAEVAA
jgi:hypothetical protein